MLQAINIENLKILGASKFTVRGNGIKLGRILTQVRHILYHICLVGRVRCGRISIANYTISIRRLFEKRIFINVITYFRIKFIVFSFSRLIITIIIPAILRQHIQIFGFSHIPTKPSYLVFFGAEYTTFQCIKRNQPICSLLAVINSYLKRFDTSNTFCDHIFYSRIRYSKNLLNNAFYTLVLRIDLVMDLGNFPRRCKVFRRRLSRTTRCHNINRTNQCRVENLTSLTIWIVMFNGFQYCIEITSSGTFIRLIGNVSQSPHHRRHDTRYSKNIAASSISFRIISQRRIPTNSLIIGNWLQYSRGILSVRQISVFRFNITLFVAKQILHLAIHHINTCIDSRNTPCFK